MKRSRRRWAGQLFSFNYHRTSTHDQGMAIDQSVQAGDRKDLAPSILRSGQGPSSRAWPKRSSSPSLYGADLVTKNEGWGTNPLVRKSLIQVSFNVFNL